MTDLFVQFAWASPQSAVFVVSLNSMTTLETIIALIFTPTAIVAGIVIILRKFFEQALSRDIEKYKTNLQTEFEHSKIRLENELQTRFFEYQTKFSSYHQKRAEVIGELYGLLSDAVECVRDLIHPVQWGGEETQAEKRQVAAEKYNKLGQYYIRSRIYLDEDVCEGMESIFKTMKLALAKFNISQEPHGRDPGLWGEAWKSMEDEVPPLLKKLERQFRQSLSAESHQDALTISKETKG